MEEWKEYKLKNVCEVINGRAYKQEELLEEGKYRVLRVGNIFQGNNWYYSNLELPEDKYCNKGDLLYAWSCGFAPYIWEGEKTIYHYHIWKLVEDKKIVDKHFLYYYLIENTKNFLGGTHGSVMLHLTKKDMEDQVLKLPSLSYQKNIASILKSLDDKIEVNRRINENLEQQAQALFKSWLVDFEPFKDGEFVESELGMIPKGWRVGTLSEISLFSKKKIKTSQLTKENYYSTENMLPNKGGVITASSLPSTLYTPMCTLGDTIISNIRPYFKKIYYCKESFAGCSSDVLCFVPISKEWSEYLFMALYDDNFFDYMMLGAKGTKMPRGDKKQIMKYPLYIPNSDWLTKFNNIVHPIVQLIQNNRDESRRLATLRDTLLPKLMSGELKVNEVEKTLT